MTEAERRRGVREAQAMRVYGKQPPPGHPAATIFETNAQARRSRSRGPTPRSRSRGPTATSSSNSSANLSGATSASNGSRTLRSTSQVRRHRSTSRSATARSKERAPAAPGSKEMQDASMEGQDTSATAASTTSTQGGVPESQKTFMQRRIEAYQRWLQRRGKQLVTREQPAANRRPRTRQRSIDRTKPMSRSKSRGRVGPPKAKVTGAVAEMRALAPTPKVAWESNAPTAMTTGKAPSADQRDVKSTLPRKDGETRRRVLAIV